MLYCAAAVLFKFTPKCLYTYCVNPEQSNPLGDVPPYTYLHPKYCFAYDTTELADADAVVFDVVVFAFDVLFVAVLSVVLVGFCSLVVSPLLDVSFFVDVNRFSAI